jgi:hypothetical protein
MCVPIGVILLPFGIGTAFLSQYCKYRVSSIIGLSYGSSRSSSFHAGRYRRTRRPLKGLIRIPRGLE